MGKRIEKLSALFVYFCIATVLALVIVAGYIFGTGTLDDGKFDKMLAIAHGVELVLPDSADATGQTVGGDSRDQASLEHAEHVRDIKWRDFEIRENNLRNMVTEFKLLKDELETKRASFSLLIVKAKAELDKEREKEYKEENDFDEIPNPNA